MKWLAAGGIALLALMVLLWLQLRSPADAATARPAEKPPMNAEQRAAASYAEATKKLEAETPTVPAGKIDPATDAFTYAFDEVVPQNLTAPAAKCYTGGLHRVTRNAKLKLAYNIEIKNGDVTVHDMKVVESTLNDPALEACFVREVSKATWHDDRLPDWKQQDELVIRPERGMKKFTKENMDYEGSGPIEKVTVQPKPQPGSREPPVEHPPGM